MQDREIDREKGFKKEIEFQGKKLVVSMDEKLNGKEIILHTGEQATYMGHVEGIETLHWIQINGKDVVFGFYYIFSED